MTYLPTYLLTHVRGALYRFCIQYLIAAQKPALQVGKHNHLQGGFRRRIKGESRISSKLFFDNS